MNKHLYELGNLYIEIFNRIENEEDFEQYEDALNDIQDAFENKAENIAMFIKDLDNEAEMIKLEEKRLAERRKALENKSKSLKSYLEAEMIRIDKRKFKTTLFSFGIQKNPASLRIIDESKIPEDYFIIEKKLNNADIKEAVKNGLLTEAAELVQGESLRIR